MNLNNILVYDFETGGRDPYSCEITQVAAIVVHPRTLEPIKNAEFKSYVRPLDMDKVEAKALEVTRLTKEFLAEQPGPDIVWQQFVSFVDMYKCGAGRSQWDNPIPAGHNITNYDNIIARRYNEKYNKGKDTFHPIKILDTYQLCNYWFENTNEPSKYNMDYLRDYFGLSLDGAHDALVDVKDTATILRWFLILSRHYTTKIGWQNAREKQGQI